MPEDKSVPESAGVTRLHAAKTAHTIGNLLPKLAGAWCSLMDETYGASWDAGLIKESFFRGRKIVEAVSQGSNGSSLILQDFVRSRLLWTGHDSSGPESYWDREYFLSPDTARFLESVLSDASRLANPEDLMSSLRIIDSLLNRVLLCRSRDGKFMSPSEVRMIRESLGDAAYRLKTGFAEHLTACGEKNSDFASRQEKAGDSTILLKAIIDEMDEFKRLYIEPSRGLKKEVWEIRDVYLGGLAELRRDLRTASDLPHGTADSLGDLVSFALNVLQSLSDRFTDISVGMESHWQSFLQLRKRASMSRAALLFGKALSRGLPIVCEHNLPIRTQNFLAPPTDAVSDFFALSIQQYRERAERTVRSVILRTERERTETISVQDLFLTKNELDSLIAETVLAAAQNEDVILPLIRAIVSRIASHKTRTLFLREVADNAVSRALGILYLARRGCSDSAKLRGVLSDLSWERLDTPLSVLIGKDGNTRGIELLIDFRAAKTASRPREREMAEKGA